MNKKGKAKSLLSLSLTVLLFVQLASAFPLPSLYPFLPASSGFPIKIEVLEALPLGKIVPQSFEIGLLAGDVKTKMITLENLGFDVWRGISLTQPTLSFVKLQSLPNIGDIAPGKTASFALSFEPPSDLPTGSYAQNPLLEVRSQNGPTIPINVGIVITSSKQGNIVFSIINADKPRDSQGNGVSVPGANVTLVSLDISGLQFIKAADLNGVADFTDVPSGRYSYRAEAKDYLPFSSTLDIEPGLSKTQEVPLSKSMVTYEWSVTPTLIEDRYDITLTVPRGKNATGGYKDDMMGTTEGLNKKPRFLPEAFVTNRIYPRSLGATARRNSIAGILQKIKKGQFLTRFSSPLITDPGCPCRDLNPDLAVSQAAALSLKLQGQRHKHSNFFINRRAGS